MRINFAYKKPYYQKTGIDQRQYCQEAYDRFEKLKMYDELRKEGCSEKIAFKAIKVPRSTYFRWKKNYRKYGLQGLEDACRAPLKRRESTWTHQDELLVLKVRREFPLWGKAKIAVICKREYDQELSESTVGRILSKLVKKEKVRPVSFYIGRFKPKKARSFNYHAKRLPLGLKSKKPGDLIQIDHASIDACAGYSVKHFDAICPTTKIAFGRAYSRATAACARDFLEYIIKQFPFLITGIQVDGGSEFMGDFEEGCAQLGITLWVLPPREPEMNGSVERFHKSPKYEFYPFYQGKLKVSSINKELAKYNQFYNGFRPHQALQQRTPMESWKIRGGQLI